MNHDGEGTMTKIAFVSDDGTTISRHYGRARSFVVVTVDGGREISREVRPKANHAMFAGPQESGGRESGGQEGGEGGYKGSRGRRQGGYEEGHGEGPWRHQMMLASCRDCDVLVVGGIGSGALANLVAAGVQPIVSGRRLIDEALADWLAGRLQHHPERVHAPSGMGPGRRSRT
jgi:predicted Fe-Mo cluster-binding NifX family protein